MSKVKITWKAFGDQPERGRFISSVEVELAKQVSDDFRICEAIYKVTNLQGELAEFGASLTEINLWKTIESKLSPTKTHISLSVGDEIEIDGRAYICADLGFIKVSEAEIRTFPDGAIWSVLKKAEVSA